MTISGFFTLKYSTWKSIFIDWCISTCDCLQYGISGAFWYAAGATIQLFLFATLTVQLKLRAPGAKTFLQVIRARFGRTTHITYCVFAVLTNVIVTAMLMLGKTLFILYFYMNNFINNWQQKPKAASGRVRI